jgi:hypothetical protein
MLKKELKYKNLIDWLWVNQYIDMTKYQLKEIDKGIEFYITEKIK